MVRVKKTVEVTDVTPEEIPEEVTPEDEPNEVMTRVVNKLQKVITIKKQLSDRQQAHLDKLAKARNGTKYAVKAEEPKPVKKVVKKKEIVAEPKKKVVKKVQVVEKVVAVEPIFRFSRNLF